MSRFLSLLLPCLDALTDDIEVPDRRFLGAMPQQEARWWWSGKSAMTMKIEMFGLATTQTVMARSTVALMQAESHTVAPMP